MFAKSLNFYVSHRTRRCSCRMCQRDGWRERAPGLCFMKVKGPWGWSVEHIIPVEVLVWMNQDFLLLNTYRGPKAAAEPRTSNLTLWVLSSHVLAIWAWNQNVFSRIHSLPKAWNGNYMITCRLIWISNLWHILFFFKGSSLITVPLQVFTLSLKREL